jgi:hypothetical protein
MLSQLSQSSHLHYGAHIKTENYQGILYRENNHTDTRQKGNIASSTTPLQATTIVDITTAQQSNTAGIYK